MMIALLLVLPAVLAAGRPNTRIVGGSDVDIADYPWQVNYADTVNLVSR